MESFVFPWQIIVMTLVMNLLDYVSGFSGAAKNGDIRSDKMREGLWHKAGFCLLIIVSIAIEVANVWLKSEFAGYDVSIPQFPSIIVVCVIIIGTELVSICENLCVLNPQIKTFAFMQKLKDHNPNGADVTVEIEEDRKPAHSKE